MQLTVTCCTNFSRRSAATGTTSTAVPWKIACGLLLQIAERLRGLMPEELPLFVRISATDWVESGWDIEQSVELAKQRWGERPKSAGLQKMVRDARRSRLEKQPTDLRRKTCYFGDRTLDFRYDGDTV